MKILIATEGSEFSRAAVKMCCRMFGENYNHEIRILSTFEPMIPPTEPFATPVDVIQKVDQESRMQANVYAAEAKDMICSCVPALSEKMSVDVKSGSPAKVIVETAEDWGADLIVVGSHGYGFWKRTFLGSVSNSVVHHAPCSVLVVRSPGEEREH